MEEAGVVSNKFMWECSFQLHAEVVRHCRAIRMSFIRRLSKPTRGGGSGCNFHRCRLTASRSPQETGKAEKADPERRRAASFRPDLGRGARRASHLLDVRKGPQVGPERQSSGEGAIWHHKACVHSSSPSHPENTQAPTYNNLRGRPPGFGTPA